MVKTGWKRDNPPHYDKNMWAGPNNQMLISESIYHILQQFDWLEYQQNSFMGKPMLLEAIS